MGAVKRYLSYAQFEALLGVSHSTMVSLRRRNRLIDPDCFIGDLPGWDRKRALRFGRETGRLDEHDNPTTAPYVAPSRAVRPKWWDVPNPVIYMSQTEVGEELGVNPNHIRRQRERGTFAAPDAAIGDPEGNPRRGNVVGWLKDPTITAYKRQTRGLHKAG